MGVRQEVVFCKSFSQATKTKTKQKHYAEDVSLCTRYTGQIWSAMKIPTKIPRQKEMNSMKKIQKREK